MPDVISERSGRQVLHCAPDGPPITGEQAVVDLIGASYGADLVVLPPSATTSWPEWADPLRAGRGELGGDH